MLSPIDHADDSRQAVLVAEYSITRNFLFPVTISTSSHLLLGIFVFCEVLLGTFDVHLAYTASATAPAHRSPVASVGLPLLSTDYLYPRFASGDRSRIPRLRRLW